MQVLPITCTLKTAKNRENLTGAKMMSSFYTFKLSDDFLRTYCH